jgi:hypothetical protein
MTLEYFIPAMLHSSSRRSFLKVPGLDEILGTTLFGTNTDNAIKALLGRFGAETDIFEAFTVNEVLQHRRDTL